ncbi:hypothetical protein F5884DRAFT_902407 [Xylogone sp. PMI_703]|nr:hypothetical protein F5884DRAFT_902407 [Xylogone sp. PMI_703]
MADAVDRKGSTSISPQILELTESASTVANILANRGFDVDIFITGMHMVKEKTWTPGDNEIRNATATMEATFQLLQRFNYDLLIMHDDRLEAKAAADAAHLFRCRLGHVEGGDLTGGDDNKNRYAITATQIVIFQAARMPLIALSLYDIPFKEFRIASFHPSSPESETSGKQAESFYETLLASGRNLVVPRPNNGKGTEKVQEILDALPKDGVCVAPKFEFGDYVALLRAAGCVAGNSSVIVTSAPAIGKLCLNIGSRH